MLKRVNHTVHVPITNGDQTLWVMVGHNKPYTYKWGDQIWIHCILYKDGKEIDRYSVVTYPELRKIKKDFCRQDNG